MKRTAIQTIPLRKEIPTEPRPPHVNPMPSQLGANSSPHRSLQIVRHFGQCSAASNNKLEVELGGVLNDYVGDRDVDKSVHVIVRVVGRETQLIGRQTCLQTCF
jgi:hypothetical protein